PPQAGEEIAETEPPADKKGPADPAHDAFARTACGAVEQPDENRKRDEAGGEEVERRLREGGKRPGGERRHRPAPSPQQYYLAGKALHLLPDLARIIRVRSKARLPES